MLKPSDFNNAVPQFQNGNYASNPINPQYVEEPSSTDYNRGTEPLQTLPAQWWNWFMNKFTSRFNKVNIYVKNLFNELAQLLSLVNVTPDGTEGAVTDGQLKNAFKELYPDYINTKLALKATYVKKTQKVNNHALSGDVTVSKSDVGLGNVVNTGDSATPVENGTTKFTTGGAYTELNKKQNKTLSTALDINEVNVTTVESALANLNGATYLTKLNGKSAGSITYHKLTIPLSTAMGYQTKTFSLSGRLASDNLLLVVGGNGGSNETWQATVKALGIIKQLDLRYTYTPTNTYLYIRVPAWQSFSITQIAGLKGVVTITDSTEEEYNTGTSVEVFSVDTKTDLTDIAPAFSTSTSYAVGDYVTYNGNMYRCTVAHRGAWNSSNFTLVTVGGELSQKVDKTTTVNGHALSGNVTVTKADLGLGNVANKDLSNVVNTGDSATPVSGGTTKFTTGGAYTELNKKFDKTSAGDQVTYSLSGNTLTITSLA